MGDVRECARLQRWRACGGAVRALVHVAERGLLVLLGGDGPGGATVWTVGGGPLGELGRQRWSEDGLVALVQHGRQRLSSAGEPGSAARAERTVWADAAGVRRGDGPGLYRRRSLVMSRQSSFRGPVAGIGGAPESPREEGPDRPVPEENGARSLPRIDDAGEGGEEADGGGDAGRGDEEDVVRVGAAGRLSVTVCDARFATRAARQRGAVVAVRLEGPGDERQERTVRLRRDAGRDVGQRTVSLEVGGYEGVWLQAEVFDYDSDEDHIFVGQVRRRLSELLQSANRTEAWYPLARRDGSHPGRAGTVLLRLQFAPDAAGAGARPPSPTLREALWRLQTRQRDGRDMPVPQILRETKPGPSGAVTALATQRWDTRDFRQLSVYQMHGGPALRPAKAPRREPEDGAAGRPATRGGAAEAEYSFPRDSLPGRLERAFERLPPPPPVQVVGHRSPRSHASPLAVGRRRETAVGIYLDASPEPGSPGLRRGRSGEESAGGGAAARRGTMRLESAYTLDVAVPSSPLRAASSYPPPPSTAPAGLQRAAAEPITRLGSKLRRATATGTSGETAVAGGGTGSGNAGKSGTGIGGQGGEVMFIRTNCMLKILCPGRLRPGTAADKGGRTGTAYTAR